MSNPLDTQINIAHNINSVRKRKTGFPFIVFVFAILLGVFSLHTIVSKNSSTVSKVASTDSLQLDVFYPSNTPTPTLTPTKAPIPTPTPQPGVTYPPTNTPTPYVYVTPTPITNPCGSYDTGKKVNPGCYCSEFLIHCQGGFCDNLDLKNSGNPDGFPSCHALDQGTGVFCRPPFATEGDGWYCIAKPVIYLYPKTPTYIDVSVETPGSIVVSDPLYPIGGWKNVLAQPNGKLTYQGKIYRELFYESSVSSLGEPENGITLKTKNIRQELDNTISSLGLIEDEKTEFLDFWVPRLQQFHTPYVMFSVISQSEKEKVDRVIISPKPETRIEFIAYFKPLLRPYEGKALILPSTPPERIGFTEVEWGGVIGH